MARGTTFMILFAAAVALAASPARAQMTVDVEPYTQGSSKQVISIPVHLVNPSESPIDAFGLTLTYPASLLDYVQVKGNGTLTDGWIALSGIEGTPGVVTVGGFNPNPVDTSGVFFNVVFKVLTNVIGTDLITLSGFVDDVAGATSTGGSFEAVVQPGAAGLLGQYHNNRSLSNLVLERIDPLVNFDWGPNSPDPTINNDFISIKWIGFVQPDFTETYTFYTVTDDGVRLWVDGQMLIDQWIDQSATEWSGQIALTAGQPVSIEMQYYERGGNAVAKLLWSAPSVEKAVIPPDNLLAAACGSGLGDVDGDAILTTGDADCTFEIYMNEGVLPATCNYQGYACELQSADTNCDAQVTPGDAREIELRRLAGLPPAVCFAQQTMGTPPPYDIAIDQEVVDDGGTPRLRVTVSTADAQGMSAYGFRLLFPDADLALNRFEPGYKFLGWPVADAIEVAPGEILTGAWDVAPLAASAAAQVAHFYFDFAGAPGTVGGLGLTDLVDDFAGANIVGTVTGVRSPDRAGYRLLQNYPNPFNPVTNIRFHVMEGATAPVRLAVYSVRGELVRVLVDGVRPAGVHDVLWDGTNTAGASVPSGIYFYELRAGSHSESRRMVLLK
jgi:hypothetical protein